MCFALTQSTRICPGGSCGTVHWGMGAPVSCQGSHHANVCQATALPPRLVCRRKMITCPPQSKVACCESAVFAMHFVQSHPFRLFLSLWVEAAAHACARRHMHVIRVPIFMTGCPLFCPPFEVIRFRLGFSASFSLNFRQVFFSLFI